MERKRFLVSFSGRGDSGRVTEYNFYSDPEAPHIVFDLANCPVAIMPWETCIHESALMSAVSRDHYNKSVLIRIFIFCFIHFPALEIRDIGKDIKFNIAAYFE